MIGSTGTARGLARLALVGAMALKAVAAGAAQPDDCPTFVPDFRCDRSGRYEGFVQPIIAPYLFEDPFITTGLYSVFIWHQFPKQSAFDRGTLYDVALQARLAITDKLAFIATKDGFAMVRPGRNSVVERANDITDITIGLKYAAIDRPEDNFILSPAIRFEIPAGSRRVYQGYGKGSFIPSLSAAWGPMEKVHLIGNVGGQVPLSNETSTSFFYQFHADYALHKHFVPLFNLSGMYWTGGGDGQRPINTILPAPFRTIPLTTAQDALFALGATDLQRWEGADYANLGSIGVGGLNLVTIAFGARIPITKRVNLGAAYEFPITSTQAIFQQRVTVSLVYEW